MLVVDAGAAGAGGVFGIGQEPVGIAKLHLSAGRVVPRAIDLITVQPFTGRPAPSAIVPSSDAFCEAPRVSCHPSG